MNRGRFLCLLRGEAAPYDQRSLVEPEVHGRPVEGERPCEEGVEAGVDRAPRRALARRAAERSRRARPAVSIVRPVTRLMCAWAIGSIHSPACPARKSQSAFEGWTWITPCTVPTVSPAAPVARNFQRWPFGFGHAHEPRLEDGQEDGRREAPVADPHHACPHADRGAVPVAHARLRGLILPAVPHAHPDCDPVGDEGDVEHREPAGGEPEGALREPVARERPSDDRAAGRTSRAPLRSASPRRRSSGACWRDRGRDGPRTRRSPAIRRPTAGSSRPCARCRARGSAPPVTKYLASLPSWRPSSSSVYGFVRIGGFLPGMNAKTAASRRAKNAA